MSFEQEVADALPSHFDVNGLMKALGDPRQAFSILDSNGDGKITHEDLKALLERFGIKGTAGKLIAKLLFKKLDTDKSGTIEMNDLVGAQDIMSSILKLKK